MAFTQTWSHRLTALGIVSASLAGVSAASAMPTAPGLVCETYPGAPTCVGALPDCKTCHEKTQQPVVMNAFGRDVSIALEAYTTKPFDPGAFNGSLPFALTDVEGLDSDGDGHTNLTELLEGTFPGDKSSIPREITCPADVSGLDYPICQYDLSFTYRKVNIDFCGMPPTFEEMEAFRAAPAGDQKAQLHAKLDACVDTQFWQGFDGVVWSIAHEKIKPLMAFFQPETNFFGDYALFTWSQIDGHDVRDMLMANYHVTIDTPLGEGELSLLEYKQVDTLPGQPMQPERRAGMLTLAWPLFYNTMFTALPRTTAAQAYRAFLGLDIAKSQGLDWPIAGEPIDYDNAGVGQGECAQCHATLDPLAYPFATYNGIQFDGAIGPFMYDPNRINKYFADQFPEMVNMPESGYIFGQKVDNLMHWAYVAANSDAFYSARVEDYWKLLMGESPRADDAKSFAEYTALWESLRNHHSIETMLHELIETEAYGAP
jgi:hypothetical protein